MSNTLRGSKRLQVIQRWLQGIDDPQWEVFPTKKEGRYIVRARKAPLTPQLKSTEVNDDVIDNDVEQPVDMDSHDELIENEEPSTPPLKTKQPNNRKQHQYTTTFDPTINLEILNTLKSLGDEIKREREEKAQKRLMKQVLHKEMYGNYNRRTPFNDPYNGMYEPNSYEHDEHKQKNNERIEYDDDEYEEEPAPIIQLKPATRRRNNIFADIY